MKTLVLAIVLATNLAYADQISLNDIMTNSAATHEVQSGLKDFRVVIPGVLYRGGNSGGGQMPLSATGLKALCDKGFSQVVYVYPHNFVKSAPTACATGSVEYNTFGPYIKDRASIKTYLQKVKRIIENKEGPLYVHCWNGWHASGEMAAYALMQFCGMNGAQAQAYWDANVPSRDIGKVQRMKRFVVFEDLNISADDQARICPR